MKYETKVCISVPLAQGRRSTAEAVNTAMTSLADGKLAKLVQRGIETAALEPDAWDVESIKLQVELESKQLTKADGKFQIVTFTWPAPF